MLELRGSKAHAGFRNSFAPYRGRNPQNREKRVSESKTPISPGNAGFFDSETLFFPRFLGFRPLQGANGFAMQDEFFCGRLIFIHLQCWEVLPFLTIQRQQCIKFRVLRAQDLYTPLSLKCQKGSTSQHRRCIKISLPYIVCGVSPHCSLQCVCVGS